MGVAQAQEVRPEHRPNAIPNKGIKFFNAGDRIAEPLPYSLPQDEGSDIHAIATYRMDAPEDDFFNVPTQIKFRHSSAVVLVDFSNTILRKFGQRGVIMIDAEFEETESNADQPIASSEDAAIEKGKEKWRKYLEDICLRHIDQCQRARAGGGWPLAATGFTKRALKLMNYDDPADAMLREMKHTPSAAAAPSADVKVLQDQIAMLTRTVEQMQKSNKATEDAKKANATDAAIDKHTGAGEGEDEFVDPTPEPQPPAQRPRKQPGSGAKSRR
jgi:hypothetical protein